MSARGRALLAVALGVAASVSACSGDTEIRLFTTRRLAIDDTSRTFAFEVGDAWSRGELGLRVEGGSESLGQHVILVSPLDGAEIPLRLHPTEDRRVVEASWSGALGAGRGAFRFDEAVPGTYRATVRVSAGGSDWHFDRSREEVDADSIRWVDP